MCERGERERKRENKNENEKRPLISRLKILSP